ncbi:MAG TPA: hypothetical protein VF584_07295 [Longimicrobium sp.]|jgi:hypothetical protein
MMPPAVKILILLIAAAIATACEGSQPRSETPKPRAAQVRSVEYVDSIPYQGELYGGFLRRVVVRTDRGPDTLPDVRVEAASGVTAVAGDSVVYGISSHADDPPRLFAYDARTRGTRILAPPANWIAHEGVSFAPGAGHVAYLGRDSTDGSTYAAVAKLPSGDLVLRGAGVAARATDAGVATMRWLDADRFQITIDLDADLGRAYRVQGSLAARGISGDTIPRPPGEHTGTTAP